MKFIILFLRLYTVGLSAQMYGIILLYASSVKDKGYYVRYSMIRFIYKLILAIFYLLMVIEFYNGNVTYFSYLCVLLTNMFRYCRSMVKKLQDTWF